MKGKSAFTSIGTASEHQIFRERGAFQVSVEECCRVVTVVVVFANVVFFLVAVAVSLIAFIPAITAIIPAVTAVITAVVVVVTSIIVAAQAAVAEAGALAASPVRWSAPVAGERPAFGTCLVVVAPLPHHLVAVVFPFLRFAWRLPEWLFGRCASLLCAGGGRFAASAIR